jgi:proteasome accessory factor B
MPPKNPPRLRQWKLIEILKKSKNGITIKNIAAELGTGERTVLRDMAKLKKTGLPIRGSTEAHGRKRWRIAKNPVASSTFNFEEAAAFYLGYRFLAPISNSFIDEAAQGGLRKIRKQLGKESIRLLDQLLEIFRESTTGWSDYSEQSDIILTLIQACEDKNETVIHDRSFSAAEEQSYVIHPYALITQMGTLYVVGFSCKRNELRTWKLNRIVKAECLKTKFKKPKDYDTDTYRRKCFGVFAFNNKPVQKVRIKVDGGGMARYVQEHHWHETQQFEQQPDGSVIVRFDVIPNVELVNWILRLGRNAEVLEPKSLRQTVKTEIAEMNRRYRK